MVEEEKEEKQEKKEEKKSIVKWVVIGLALIVLVAAGLGGWYFYRSSSVKKVAQPIEEVEPEPGIWSPGSMIVNLMDNNGERYLKTTIQIEVSSKDCIEELDLLKPKIMDNMLVLLSSKSYKEIAGFDGKQTLRDDIAVRLNRYLTKGQVRRIYFTEFLIQ